MAKKVLGLGKRKRKQAAQGQGQGQGQRQGQGAAKAKGDVLVVDDEAWAEAQLLADQLEIPSGELLAMVADDLGIDGADPNPKAPEAQEHAAESALLSASTIEVYVSAIAELYHMQRSLGQNSCPALRGPALNNLLETRKRQQDTVNRAAFMDRGATGITNGYTDEEFWKLQDSLLKGASNSVQVSCKAFLLYSIYSILTAYFRTYEHEWMCFLGTIW
jgi:hypothetical protein